jgi:hypothetical protein
MVSPDVAHDPHQNNREKERIGKIVYATGGTTSSLTFELRRVPVMFVLVVEGLRSVVAVSVAHIDAKMSAVAVSSTLASRKEFRLRNCARLTISRPNSVYDVSAVGS